MRRRPPAIVPALPFHHGHLLVQGIPDRVEQARSLAGPHLHPERKRGPGCQLRCRLRRVHMLRRIR